MTQDTLDKVSGDDEQVAEGRREFLIGLGKWSRAVIVGAVGGGTLLAAGQAQAGWINRRGGWVNGSVGGGSWVNANGGGSWANRRGSGFGGSWVNRR